MDDDFFAVARLGQNMNLCISSISKQTFDEAGSQHFNSERGYFIYERDGSLDGCGISILAKVASIEAAHRFAELWQKIKTPVAGTPSTGATLEH